MTQRMQRSASVQERKEETGQRLLAGSQWESAVRRQVCSVILMAALYHIQPLLLRRQRRRQSPGRYGHPVVALDAVRRSKQRGGSGGGSVQRAASEYSFPASFIEARLRRLDLQHTSQISDLAKRNEQCEETGIHPRTNARSYNRSCRLIKR